MNSLTTKQHHPVYYDVFRPEGSQMEYYYAEIPLIQAHDENVLFGRCAMVHETMLEMFRDNIPHKESCNIQKGYEQTLWLPYVGGDTLHMRSGLYLVWAKECCFLVCRSKMVFTAALVLMGVTDDNY